MTKSIKTLRENLISYSFLSPLLLFFIVFMLIPLVWTLYLSLFSGGILQGLRFAGLNNFLALFRNRIFLTSLRVTGIYVAIVIPTVILISLFLAVLIVDRHIRAKNIFKVALFFPNLAPMVVLAVLWYFIIHPEIGLLNIILRSLKITPPNWLGSTSFALVAILLLELWRGIGFYMVIYIAALIAIPNELYEAAVIDGAMGFRRLTRITLPLIRPTLLFTLVMATIWNFQVFDSVFVLTRGGPANSTSSVVWYIYANAFQYDKLGFASTMAVVLMTIILVLSLLQFKFLRSDFYY